MYQSSYTSTPSSVAAENNRIDRIAGLHLDGDNYLTLRWEVHYIPSKEMNPILLKMFLEGRFGRDGYGPSLIGNTMYQLWSPKPLTQVKHHHCKHPSLGF